MNKSLVAILGIVVVLVLGWYFWDSGMLSELPGESQEMHSQEGEEAAEEESGMTAVLMERSESGQSGTATIIELEGQTRVALEMEGVPDDILQPAHIHVGTCEDLGPVAYPLSDVSGTGTGPGGSETTMSTSFEQLIADLPLAINVHHSYEMIQEYVACGDIVMP